MDKRGGSAGMCEVYLVALKKDFSSSRSFTLNCENIKHKNFCPFVLEVQIFQLLCIFVNFSIGVSFIHLKPQEKKMHDFKAKLLYCQKV